MTVELIAPNRVVTLCQRMEGIVSKINDTHAFKFELRDCIRLMRDALPRQNDSPVASRAAEIVASKCGVSVVSLYTSARSHRVARARQLAMYACVQCGLKSEVVGSHFHRCRTSVNVALRATQNRLDTKEISSDLACGIVAELQEFQKQSEIK